MATCAVFELKVQVVRFSLCAVFLQDKYKEKLQEKQCSSRVILVCFLMLRSKMIGKLRFMYL